MKAFLSNAEYQDNPITVLKRFLDQEQSNKLAGNYNEMRFVGYVLDIGYDSAKIITCDTYKKVVGGIPRGSFLIMVPVYEGKLYLVRNAWVIFPNYSIPVYEGKLYLKL